MTIEQGPFTGEYPAAEEIVRALAMQGLLTYANTRVRQLQGDRQGSLVAILGTYRSAVLNAQYPHMFRITARTLLAGADYDASHLT